MNTRNHQAGWTAMGLLGFMLLGAFAFTCAIKLIPVYMEHQAIAGAISDSIEDGVYDGMSPRQIRSRIAKSFDMNMVEDTNAKALAITRAKGITTIDANYEVRMPFISNIDVVVRFEDLVYKFKTE